MIFFIGLLFAVLIAAVSIAIFRLQALTPRRFSWWKTATGAVFLVLLAVVVFRPDEELESGEDPGVYFNAAIAFAERQSLCFEDPALAGLDPDQRAFFRYGHAGFLNTKDAVLWADDETMDPVGAFFFPAYSILLALPVSLGFPYGVFWISPLLAVLCGWLLAVLARWLCDESAAAGRVAFLLYILNPVIIWNARALRAEWAASFLALAGLTLWLAHVSGRKSMRPFTVLLAGISLSFAPLFHITALYVVFPAVFVTAWRCRRSVFWLMWSVGLLVGLLLFAAQMLWITDPYWLGAALARAGRYRVLVAGCLAFVPVMLGWRWLWSRFSPWFTFRGVSAGQVAGGMAAVLFVTAVILSVHMRTEQGHIPGLPPWIVNFISLTDFTGVSQLVSRCWSALALLGIFLLCTRKRQPGTLGRYLFLLLGPASLTIGWVFNYMFETRRMLTFLTPLIVLSTTLLLYMTADVLSRHVRKAGANGGRLARFSFNAVLVAGVCMLLAIAMRGRLVLYHTWNNHGTFRFYEEVASAVEPHCDFLFAEYTQTAVPIAYLSGLPLLPVAWGYRNDIEYREAERLMANLVLEHPERRHLLISPFAGAAIAGVRLEPLFSKTLHSQRLERSRRQVPSRVHPRDLTLHVQRLMPPKEKAAEPLEYRRLMNGSRLGLSGAANFMPNRTIEMQGTAVKAGHSFQFELTLPDGQDAHTTLMVVLAKPSEATLDRLDVGWGTGTASKAATRSALGPGWEVVMLPVPAKGVGNGNRITIEASSDLFLTDVLLACPATREVVTLETGLQQVAFSMATVDSQWLKADAALVLPEGGGPRLLWLLATHGRTEPVEVRASIRTRGTDADWNSFRIAPGWHWVAVPLESSSPEVSFQWHDLRIRPSWNPETSGSHENLGVRVHLINSMPHP